VDKIKIVVTDYIEPDLKWEEEQLAKYENVTFEYYQLKFAPREELIAKIRDADLVLVNMAPMTAEVINSLEKCRLILRHGIGYDNVDVSAATAKGIRVGNVPDYCANEVAEHAVMLMLAAWRKLFLGRKVLEGSSARGLWDFEQIYPIYSLRGKTIAIIGCGRIGRLVLRKVAGFECRVLVCDPYLSEEQKKALGVEHTPFDTVLREADLITLHVPLTPETRYLFNEAAFRAMKETAYLVNTSRGAVVDAAALAQALREGWIAGAAIDVYEKEPPDPSCELFDLPNCTLAPHLGWYSEEAGWTIRYKIMEDFERFIEGRPPRFQLNPEVG